MRGNSETLDFHNYFENNAKAKVCFLLIKKYEKKEGYLWKYE